MDRRNEDVKKKKMSKRIPISIIWKRSVGSQNEWIIDEPYRHEVLLKLIVE